ncbi:T9SS type A sorting domain-containing protein [Psychroserpens sp.]
MKLAFSLLLMFSSLTFTQAQIVDIPNASLKHILTTDNCVDLNDDGVGDADADTNDDGEIQESEAEAVEYLILDSATPSMRIVLDLTGLEAFVYLKSFYSADVNFSEQQNIGGNLQYVGVDPIDFTSNSNLERIDIADEILISSIDVSGLTNLTDLRLFWFRAVFEFGGPNPPAFIDVQGCSNLINLDLMDTYNTDIDFCGAPSLETINCFAFTSPNLIDLNFNCLPNLRVLNISETYTNSLFLKNGSVLESLSAFSAFGNFLCIDDNQEEEDSLGDLLDNYDYVSTTCDLFLGDNTVSGAIQTNISLSGSINENCGTNGLSSVINFDFIQNNTSVLNVQTSNTSVYEIPLGIGDYQVVPTPVFSDGYTIVPSQFDVSFSGSAGELFEQDICMEPRVETVDGIEIKFYSYYYNPDPDTNRFDAYIDLENTNATSYAADLRMVYDDNYSFVLDYDNSFPANDSNGEFIFNTINIGSNSSSRIYLRISYNSDTHPNYPLLPGDELIYDLFLTNSEDRDNQGGAPSFRLIETIDAADQTLSVEDIDNVKPSNIKIYPNPSNGIVTIENNEAIKTISIFAINGQLISTLDYNQNKSEWLQMDISHLDKGIYFLSIQTDASIFTKKIIKN